MRALAVLLFLFGLGIGCAGAHELRPAYLEILETEPETYSILWKVPARGEFRLSLHVRMPESCAETEAPVTAIADAASTSRWRVRCPGGLAGRTIVIDGLVATYTDALARIVRADGTVQTQRLTPDFPELTVVAAPTSGDTARTYFLLGVEHIMLGLDHLLFVLALLLLIGSPRRLVATITAFTVAHSVTLAFAALGLARAPQAPVEALVALSIVPVAAEIVLKQRGRSDLSSRYPWVIAFVFGLLHGFGFGGALAEIGLPQKDVPLALLTFNLGVEAGQLVFVMLALAAIGSLKLLLAIPPARGSSSLM
ncbi:membrane protein [Mesorhizobium sp. L-8-10]|uniref:HupE/UreJ family protein n=1 Tax=Mesorhizobium sp. L-8-10 TaxID=2744523 RepID=UPI001934B850|nr:HupE/UreJ family protein [Mesorhizobium sp. L-8-10]BCH29037.1 membrane protein [Mesorhizobium sp. L-8-10]